MSAARPLSHNAASGPCAVCGEAGLPCARCRVHYYCGKEHQRQHWPKHKVGCGSVELREGLLVATRDIPAGTVILREMPSLAFPSSPLTYYTSKCLLVLCVGCCADLREKKSISQCRRCGLPVCDAACSRVSDHQVECKAFQRAEYKVPKAELRGTRGSLLGAAVATLRVALAFPDNQLLHNFQPELNFDEEGLKTSPDAADWVVTIQAYMATVVHYLREVVRVKWIPEEDLNRAALIISMYTADTKGPDPTRWGHVSKQKYESLLYVGMALRKHSCYPNSGDTIMDAELKEWVVVTTRAVAAGDFISEQHQSCHWTDDTLTRRKAVLIRRGIVCDCERCSDPTELGMYVGSPCCADCAVLGKMCYLVPANKDFSIWRCKGCASEKTAEDVQALSKPAEERLNQLTGSSPEALLEFIQAQVFPRGPLHSTHTLVLRANNYFRRDIYSRRAEEHAREGEVDRWEAVIRGQLRALDQLLPGVSESRAVILLELRRLVLRRLRVAETMAMLEGVYQPFRIGAYKKAVLEVNAELCRLHFNRDEDMPKRFLIEDPFGGR